MIVNNFVKLSVYIGIFLPLLVEAQEPQFDWASVYGNGRGYDIAVDSAGNVYTMGVFGGTADFDPGPGVYNLSSQGNSDVFILKLDSSGNFLWVKQIGRSAYTGSWYWPLGGEQNLPGNIIVDPEGNLIISAVFTDTIDADPGPNEFLLYNSNHSNYFDQMSTFIVKLDQAGNFLWAGALAIPTLMTGNKVSIDVDEAGNIFLTGILEDSLTDINPFLEDTFLVHSHGDNDFFVTKLNPQGDFQWGYCIGGSGDDRAYDIATSPEGDVYVVGAFQNTVDFDPGSGLEEFTATDWFDAFILKLNTSGHYVWMRTFSGGNLIGRVQLDSKDNIITLGAGKGGFDFDPGPDTVILGNLGDDAILIHKMDSSGSYIWGRLLKYEATGPTPPNYGRSDITIDPCDNIYIEDYFAGWVDIDPGPDSVIVSHGIDGNLFILQLDSNGNYVWHSHLLTIMCDILADTKGNLYATGYCSDSIDLDPSSTEFFPNSDADYTFKLKSSCSVTTEVGSNYSPSLITVYPNPSRGQFYIDFGKSLNDVSITLWSIDGKQFSQQTFDKLKNLDFELDYSPGLYFMHVEYNNGHFILKLIKD